ncbi:MAG: 2-oxo-4-hydroxy-4-carboxy-5-ureidoimidazoline decarboxylase [Pseudomonadota bacterium]
MRINGLNEADARTALEHCCVSRKWISAMLDQRPFGSEQALRQVSDRAWSECAEGDWLEAFEGHPRIGDIQSLKAKYADTSSLAAAEQAGMQSADDSIIERLALGNKQYEDRFGFMFIVCATGKSALEMSELLEARLTNERAQELSIAAEEQRKITQLRLENLL